jgi:glucan 1,3-beta-glucosidase
MKKITRVGLTTPAALARACFRTATAILIASLLTSCFWDLPPLHTHGTKWVDRGGHEVILKGTNLGNWLLQETWMMGQTGEQCTIEQTLTTRFGAAEKERLMNLYRDSWITTRDWDVMAANGLNVVRVPFIYSLLEDDANPFHLRPDAWKYLDYAITEAAKRRMYVILDLHGAAGSQGREQHSGCSGRNWFWDGGDGHPASYYQDRTTWLWREIAKRYRGRGSVAGYGILNEPWGTDPATLAAYVKTAYKAIRQVDPDHVVILPGHSSGIDAYGVPAAQGMKNVAFEMHFYPGIFGWGQIGYGVQRDWLRCGPTNFPTVCDWDERIKKVNAPFFIGEMQPWVGQGDLGGKIARATYDTYAKYGWASTSWSYKVFTNGGGQGAGTWGMVTNVGTQEVLVKANTWDCDNWDSTFATACNTRANSVTIGGTTPTKTMYLVIKSGACCGGALDVAYDHISLVNDATGQEMIVNGDFGSNSGWTEWNINGVQSFDYGYVGSTPSAGSGPALRVQGTADNNGGVYQAVQLVPGQRYTFNGAFRDVGSPAASAWAEVYLVADQPTTGVDITGTALPTINFQTADLAAIENLFRSFGTIDYDLHEDLQHWLTSSTPPTIFTLPAQPVGLTLQEVGSNIRLDWSANHESDLTGYNVYRASVLGSYSLIASGLTAPTYTDTGTTPGAQYFYVVSATDPEDESFLSEAVTRPGTAAAVPGRIQAESFVAMSGAATESCTDTGGGLDVGFLDPGDWFEYSINVQTAGTYTVQYRIASAVGSTGFSMLVDGVSVDSQAIPNTGGWQTWSTITSSVHLDAGEHTLRFNAIDGSWNINWIDFAYVGP